MAQTSCLENKKQVQFCSRKIVLNSLGLDKLYSY